MFTNYYPTMYYSPTGSLKLFLIEAIIFALGDVEWFDLD
jgi:hypothetical protein